MDKRIPHERPPYLHAGRCDIQNSRLGARRNLTVLLRQLHCRQASRNGARAFSHGRAGTARSSVQSPKDTGLFAADAEASRNSRVGDC